MIADVKAKPARRVLLIDDTDMIRTLARALLEKVSGYEVTAVASGESGLEEARRAAPDLVLLDASMPGIGGLETLRRLKADPATAAIPVVCLTGRVDDSEAAQWLALGAIGILSKKDIRTLPSALSRLLGEG